MSFAMEWSPLRVAGLCKQLRSPDETAQRCNPGHRANTFPDSASLHPGYAGFSFKGKRWERIRKDVRQRYLLNAYRVLLTRARQGMVIVVPEGSSDDPSRAPGFYDPAHQLLAEIGVPAL
jgi:hypothetical protein